MEVRTFPADAIIIAMAANGAIPLVSRRILWCAQDRRSRRFISKDAFTRTASSFRLHPLHPGNDKLRLMSESARGEGGRVWVPKKPATVAIRRRSRRASAGIFSKSGIPSYGNLVPRDIATRAIFKVVFELNLGIDGKPMVYLDLTHIDRKILDRKLEGILEIYEKFGGRRSARHADEDFPGMHYTMGGLWVGLQAGDEYSGNICRG